MKYTIRTVYGKEQTNEGCSMLDVNPIIKKGYRTEYGLGDMK